MPAHPDRPWLVHVFELSCFSAALRAVEAHTQDLLGWEAVLAHEPRHRVRKRGFELVLATE